MDQKILFEEFVYYPDDEAGTAYSDEHADYPAARAADTDKSREKSAYETADYTDDDVAPEAALALHELACDPTGERAHEDGHDDLNKIHGILSFL